MSMLDVSLADESGLDYDEYMSDDLEGLTEEDFEEEEFEEEEDEESCGSSCSSKPKKVSLASLQGLKSHFDEVVLERMDDFNLLTLRDKAANKTNYDWIVWLQVKIPFGNHNSCSIRTDEEYIEGVCKQVLTWVNLLKNFEKKSEPKQLSLFGEELGDDELEEVEPDMPSGGNDRSWGKYWKEQERVRISNLQKKYSFFELVNLHSSWLVYHEPYTVQSWIKQLPKNNLEMIELVKDAITKGTSGDYDSRNEEFWWDDHNYMIRDGALSDYELIARVKQLIRLHLVPYKSYFHVFTDQSYSAWERETKTEYRFWFDGRKINGNSWLKTDDIPTYDLYDEDFILWLRNHFNVPHKQVISDDDILRENIKEIFGRVFKDNFNTYKEIEIAKDINQFKARANAHAKLGNGSGSGYSIDGFSASHSLFGGKKGDVITVTQSIEQRLELNRPIEGLEVYRENEVYVWKLNFQQVLEEAYRLFKKEAKKQTTLFDFIAAA